MSLRTMLEPVEATLDAIEARVAADAPASRASVGKLSIAQIRSRNAEAINAQVSRRWDLKIDGSHYSGLSNQKLLEVFRDRDDRDYAADTVQLTQERRSVLRRQFAALGRLVESSELEALDAKTIITWIVERRLGRGNGDMLFPRLTKGAAQAKARKGHAGKPIGVAIGDWRDAIRDSGRVTFRGTASIAPSATDGGPTR